MLRTRLALALAVGTALLLASACQERMPLSRIEASAAARNWCLRDGHPWGDPVEIIAPGEPEADGRRWWTVRFKAEDGEHRVQVNTLSGWVRQAP